jgi:hypothetical protein
MTAVLDPTPHIEAIVALAEEIARLAPDCAEQAAKIAEFARELGTCSPDRSTIEDAIESQMVDGELSDPQLRSVTSAVVRSLKAS